MRASLRLQAVADSGQKNDRQQAYGMAGCEAGLIMLGLLEVDTRPRRGRIDAPDGIAKAASGKSNSQQVTAEVVQSDVGSVQQAFEISSEQSKQRGTSLSI